MFLLPNWNIILAIIDHFEHHDTFYSSIPSTTVFFRQLLFN